MAPTEPTYHDVAERWAPVSGYEGLYEVSDQGRVRSVDRVVPHQYVGYLTLRGRLLKQKPDPRGYSQAYLSAGGAVSTRRVHRLVAEAFHGPCPEGQEVRHGPGGMLDNRVENLSYGTRRENRGDMRRDGTDWQLNKTTCPQKHPLVPPNLVVGAAKHGHRNCLACNRARANVHKARKRGVELDFQARADAHYHAIVQGSTTTTA